MQPDFFNIDISPDGGEKRIDGSRKKERSFHGGDSESNDSAGKASFAETLQEAAGSTGGVTENAPRRLKPHGRQSLQKTADAATPGRGLRKQSLETDGETAAAQTPFPVNVAQVLRNTPLAPFMASTTENATEGDGESATDMQAHGDVKAGFRHSSAPTFKGAADDRRPRRDAKTLLPIGAPGKTSVGATVDAGTASDEGRKVVSGSERVNREDRRTTHSAGSQWRQGRYAATAGAIDASVNPDGDNDVRVDGRKEKISPATNKERNAAGIERAAHSEPRTGVGRRNMNMMNIVSDGSDAAHLDRADAGAANAATGSPGAMRRHDAKAHHITRAADNAANGNAEHAARGAADTARSANVNESAGHAARSATPDTAGNIVSNTAPGAHADESVTKVARADDSATKVAREDHGGADGTRTKMVAATKTGSPRWAAIPAAASAPSAPAGNEDRDFGTTLRTSRSHRLSVPRMTRRQSGSENIDSFKAAGMPSLNSGTGSVSPMRMRSANLVNERAPLAAVEDSAPRRITEKPSAGIGRTSTAAQGRAQQNEYGNGQPQTVPTNAADADAVSPSRDTLAGADRTMATFGGARTEVAIHHAAAPAETGSQRAVPAEVMQQIAGKAVFMAKNGQESVSIQLNPASLGHIRLKVTTEDRQVMVRMLVENHKTRDLLEHNLGQLRVDLAHQGLTVHRMDLDLLPSNTAFGQTGDQAARDGGSQFSGRHQSEQQAAKDTADDDVPPVAWDLDKNNTLVGVFA